MSAIEVTFEQIVAYASGDMDAAQAAQIEKLVQSNPTYVRQLARIQTILGTFRTHLDTEPSAGALHRAFAAAAKAPAAEGWISRLGAIIAKCIFDSRLQPALGLRGAADTVQLSFEGELADVDLELTRDATNHWSLMGHVATRSGEPVEEIAIGMSGAATPEWTVSPNAQGVFRLQLSPASYELVLRRGADAMMIPELVLA